LRASVGATAAALFAPAAGHAAIDFDPAADPPAGEGARSVDVLETNRDGILDAVTGGGTALNRLTGLGSGALDAPVALDPDLDLGSGLVAGRFSDSVSC
jgi:hypothetical protein